MLNLDVRLIVSGREVSFDSFAAALVADIRQAVREEFNRVANQSMSKELRLTEQHDHTTSPLTVSRREAARLLGISQRTVDNYISLKAIRTVKIGKRVLIPMKSAHGVVSKGISLGADQAGQ